MGLIGDTDNGLAQTITWSNYALILGRHMTPLEHNELI